MHFLGKHFISPCGKSYLKPARLSKGDSMALSKSRKTAQTLTYVISEVTCKKCIKAMAAQLEERKTKLRVKT